jgi:type IV secretion system protein VirB9
MKNILILTAALMILATTSSQAEVNPRPSKYDNRIGFVTYNPDDVFNIYAKNGFVTILMFDEQERVINAGTGFNEGWNVTERDHILHIRPKPYVAQYSEDSNGVVVEHQNIVEPVANDWNTNLFITTNKRTYIANLRLGNKKIHYKISFSYPKEKLKQKEKEDLKKDLDRTTVPRNWAYFMKINEGSKDIAPDFVYDDGVFTYIGFRPHKTMPSVFLREGNNESMLNTHVKKIGKYNVLVVHRLGKLIMLRSGKKLVGVLNNAYGFNPSPVTKETSNNSIIRGIQQ